MNTPSEILRKHEDANEMHFHEVDRKFIIEAMEEYAKEKSEKPINLESNQTAVDWYYEQTVIQGKTNYYELLEQAKQMEKQQIEDAHIEGQRVFDKHPHTQWTNDQAEQYFNETYKTNKQ